MAPVKKKSQLPPPEDMEGESLLEWFRVCEDLAAVGKLEKANRAILILYCETWARWQFVKKTVNNRGVFTKNQNKTMSESVYMRTEMRLADRVSRLLSKLTLTPATRDAEIDAAEEVGDLPL